MACRICGDERREAIDAALRAGQSVRAVARTYGQPEALVRRHRAHGAAVVESSSPPVAVPPVPGIAHGDRAHIWPPPSVLAELRAELDAGKLTGPYADQAPRRPVEEG